MSITEASTPAEDEGQVHSKGFETYKLTYANSFPQFHKRIIIKTIEWLTARPQILSRMRRWERNQNKDPEFWKSCLDEMGIDLETPLEQQDSIPSKGALIVVCNHPHGMVDGMILGRLLTRVRSDFKILTRALLQGVEPADRHLLPVSFAHEENAVQENIKMRKAAIELLKQGGCVALFPAGTVATSQTAFGPVVEPEWAPFVAKMVSQTGASVMPIYFPGTNSRWSQIANRVSLTLRQSLLMYEIRRAFDRPQNPVIGDIIPAESLEKFKTDRNGMAVYLREQCLALKERL